VADGVPRGVLQRGLGYLRIVAVGDLLDDVSVEHGAVEVDRPGDTHLDEPPVRVVAVARVHVLGVPLVHGMPVDVGERPAPARIRAVLEQRSPEHVVSVPNRRHVARIDDAIRQSERAVHGRGDALGARQTGFTEPQRTAQRIAFDDRERVGVGARLVERALLDVRRRQALPLGFVRRADDVVVGVRLPGRPRRVLARRERAIRKVLANDAPGRVVEDARRDAEFQQGLVRLEPRHQRETRSYFRARQPRLL
jgi:hypothetical protein